jgi:tetratricopeptide (TPR) repeat protein
LLYRLGRREEAIEADIRSIALYPWNWSAWTLLGTCVDDSEEVSWIASALYQNLMLQANLVECAAPIFAVTEITPSCPILPNTYTKRVSIAYRP